jgi:hypothetical protein
MSFFDDIFGGPTTTKTVEIPASQLADMEASQKFRTNRAMPYFEKGMGQLDTMYGINDPGMLKAAQNVAGTAGQVQETTGGVGESALRTGVAGLQSLFDPRYEQMQVQQALAPAQAQYMQNLQGQRRGFGSSGMRGSARQALADRAMAGQNRLQQAQLAAQVQQGVAGQRQQVGNQLAQIGYGGMDRALAAAQAKQGASQAPMENFYKYLAAKQQTVPASFYTPPYPGAQGSETQTGADWKSIIGSTLPFIFSDERLKENIKHVKDVDGIKVYTYNYVWDKTPQQGAMAQDLLTTKYADAVSVHDSGYYQVDYTKLPELI